MKASRTVTKSPSQQPLNRWLALTLAIAVTLLGGVLYGNYSQRWGAPADLVAAGAHLAEMPRQIGRWSVSEESPIEKSALQMLECAGYANRRYIHQDSGQTISVTILVGPPGPIAVHTPEICFSSRAYDIQGDRKVVGVMGTADAENTFWRTDFKTKNAFADALRVYYAWSRGGPWKASAKPRFECAAAPLLYKIQLATPLARGTDESSTDPGREFLKDLLTSGWMLGSRGQSE
jgi:Protein of unknown function (DUF3485)